METKIASYTPGPWELRINGSDAIVVYSLEWGRIAHLQDPVHGRDERLTANAELIAAAPDMSKLIGQIRAAHDTEEKGDDLVAVCRDAHNAQRREAMREIREDENAALHAAAPELLASLKEVLEMLGNGELVRDISKDGEGGFSMRAVKLVQTVNRWQMAVAKAEPTT